MRDDLMFHIKNGCAVMVNELFELFSTVKWLEWTCEF